jgi:hypothetical protein
MCATTVGTETEARGIAKGPELNHTMGEVATDATGRLACGLETPDSEYIKAVRSAWARLIKKSTKWTRLSVPLWW